MQFSEEHQKRVVNMLKPNLYRFKFGAQLYCSDKLTHYKYQ